MAKDKSMIKLFEKSGKVGPQPNLSKMLKDKFVEMNLNEFVTSFIECLMCVIVSETTIHCVVVNNMIKFAANSVSMLHEHTSKDGRTGMYLLTEIFRLCRKYGHSNDKIIRWRFCLFLNHLLNYMSEGTVLAIELCEVATTLLLDRLQDKKPEVRAQATHALNRLQMPDNPKCRIVQKFLFHMTCDPSIEVRTAVVKEIAMFNNVVDEMLKTTLLDTNDVVRKEAYKRFVTYPFSSLTSKQRQTILEKGLDEQIGSIKSLVRKQLLPVWLKECNNDFVQFLGQIDVKNESVCEKTLRTIFEPYYDSQILDLMNEYLNPTTRMIDFDKLTVENIFLWKCIAKYLTTEKKIELARNQGHIDDDFIDVLLPDVIVFSDYVRNYYFTYVSNNDKEFILTQLLEMAKTFAIDDVGAESLNKLCFDVLLDNNTSVQPIIHIATLLNLTFKKGDDLLIFVKQILNEIQTRTIDIYPIIDKAGKKELLDHQSSSQIKTISELIENEGPESDKVDVLCRRLKKIQKQSSDIQILPEEKMLLDIAVKNLLKAFELIFQVQQLPKVGVELSLLTDIIQNIVVGYLECSMMNLRMEAIRSLAPYLLANNAIAAKEHMTTLCSEISNSMTDRNLVFKVMFEVFLRYGPKTFDMSEDLDTDEVYEDVFCVENILPLLANCIDYEIVDSSFKSVVLKGFCDLLLFNKVKSINLLSKLLILWFKPISLDTCHVYNNLMKFFTSLVINVNTSSSTLAKCYIPVLREIEEHNLTSKFNIKLDEVNATIINLTRGFIYKNEKYAINAHGELASYILDYLIDENQPYTNILVDTLYKLDIDFDQDDKLVQTLGPKLMLVMKHMKYLNDKESRYHLKKIMCKFDPVLQKKSTFMKTNLKKSVEVEKEELQAPSSSSQESDPTVEVPHSDLFSNEQILILSDSDIENENNKNEDNDDDEDIEAFTKLDAMKRLSEAFKKSINTKTVDDSSSESD